MSKLQSNLQQKYRSEVIPALMKELGLVNIMEVPAIKKVVVNAGVGNFKDSKEALDYFKTEFAQITGQKPSERSIKKSESGFKVRQGDMVGYTVTLRGLRMWAFLEKLVNIVLPRVRDFRGLSKGSFDQSGNYSIGISEHTIFPEVNPNTTKGTRHLQVTIVTNANDKAKSEKLLNLIGLPFTKAEDNQEK